MSTRLPKLSQCFGIAITYLNAFVPKQIAEGSAVGSLVDLEGIAPLGKT